MNKNLKIVNISKLQSLILKLKKRKKKIVHCHGVFDLIHLGHLRHFNKAKEYGDILIVTITSDDFVKKGPNQPVFNSSQRLETLSNLQCIDYVASNDDYDAVDLIKKIKPNFYCKGSDYKYFKRDLTGKIKLELEALKSVKAKLIITDEISFSSSKLLNDQQLTFNEKQFKLINYIKKKYTFDNIKKIIDKFKKNRVLVIGETIVDQYVFSEAVGKSGKSTMMTVKDLYQEKYLGGAGIVANHLAEFSDNIALVSILGEQKNHLAFINSELNNKIKKKFFYKKNSSTILKKRYVDINSNSKMFGVYSLNDDEIDLNLEKKIYNYLKLNLKKYDLIIVCDYGHGFITNKIAQLICKNAKFLSLNAQINSNNIRYHSIEKYNNIHSLVLNENEIRHEIRNKSDKIENVIKSLKKKKNIRDCVVTLGKGGLVSHNESKKFNYCPSFATKIIDSVGSGDALLATYSMCAFNKIEINLGMLLSSLSASQALEKMGNSKSVSKKHIIKVLSHILK